MSLPSHRGARGDADEEAFLLCQAPCRAPPRARPCADITFWCTASRPTSPWPGAASASSTPARPLAELALAYAGELLAQGELAAGRDELQHASRLAGEVGHVRLAAECEAALRKSGTDHVFPPGRK
jgi:hypothetical protein